MRLDSSDSSAFLRPCTCSIQSVPIKCATPSLSHARGDSMPRVSERVGKDAVELFRRGLADGGDEQRAGFEGRVVGVGQIEDGQRANAVFRRASLAETA